MREVKYDTGNKVNPMNGNDLRDSLIRFKITYNGKINELFCTLQKHTMQASRVEWNGTTFRRDRKHCSIWIPPPDLVFKIFIVHLVWHFLTIHPGMSRQIGFHEGRWVRWEDIKIREDWDSYDAHYCRHFLSLLFWGPLCFKVIEDEREKKKKDWVHNCNLLLCLCCWALFISTLILFRS